MATLVEAAADIAAAIDDGKPIHWDPLNAAARTASRADKDDAVAVLLDGITAERPMPAALRMLASGSLVEAGASPRIGADTIFDVVAGVAGALGPVVAADPDVDVDDTGSKHESDSVRAWSIVVIAAMARLARSVDERRRFRARDDVQTAVRALYDQSGSRHAYYLVSILDALDGEPLLIVELDGGPRPVIKDARATGIRNGFHLITLLEGHDPWALMQERAESVSATHGWFTWRALERVDGKPRARRLGNSLWGEMNAVEIPKWKDVRVVVRDEPVLGSRSWSMDFVAPIHDALDEKITVVGELGADEAQAMLDEMIGELAPT